MRMDGFTIISSCFCALTIAVTFALIIQIHFGSPQVQPHGAVATDEQICSEIGVNILKDGGNSVDASIASLICLCVTHPHLIGPGGGGVMIVHDHKLNETHVLDFMTAFPQGLSHPRVQFDVRDGRSIGVPGFLKGLEKAHRLYGVASWESLFKPAIDLARGGFTLSNHLSHELRTKKDVQFSHNFISDFMSGGLPVSGARIRRPKFAHFLEKISIGGSEEFYLLTYGAEVMDALKKAQSNVSVHDFQNYEVKERNFLHQNIQNKTIMTVGPPFGGAQILASLSLLQESEVEPTTSLENLYGAISGGLLYGASVIQKLYDAGIGEEVVNSDSFVNDLTYTRNKSYESVGGPFIPEFPASQVSAIDTKDLYVTTVVGLGSSFGSGVMTEHDVILNNHLALLPPHEDHVADELGRPYSSYAPLLIMDSNNVCGKRMVLSGGSTEAVFQVAAQVLFRNLDMTPAIIEPRLTLGDEPSVLLLDDFDDDGKKLATEVREYLKKMNFELRGLFEPLGVNGVSKFGDTVSSHSDTRTGGIAARIFGHHDL